MAAPQDKSAGIRWEAPAHATTPPSATLQDIAAIRGVGAHIMSHVPLLARLRMRALCAAFRSAVDESLESLAEIDGEQLILADAVIPARTEAWDALAWLLTKCPRVTSIHLLTWKGHDHGWTSHHHSDYDHRDKGVGTGAQGKQRFPADGNNGNSEFRARARALDVLRQIAATCQGLTCLSLEGNTDVTDEGTRTVALRCPSLARVHLAQCRAIRDATVVALAGTASRHLVSLDVGGCLRVTNISVLTLARRCPGLARLSLSGCISVSDGSVREIGTRCAGLRHLDVSWCERVTDAGILAIAEHCRDLEHLDVAMCSRVTDASINSIAKGCPSLRWLCAGRCVGVTDASIVALARGCPLLAHLELTLCAAVTDVGLRAIGARCPRLTYLDVSACRVTDAGIASLVTRHLQGPCPDAGIRHLLAIPDVQLPPPASGSTPPSHSCPQEKGEAGRGCGCQLEELYIGYCQRVTDAGVSLVAEHCPRLRRLDIAGCCGVSDASVRAVAQSCLFLEHLSAAMCENVTDNGIAAVGRHCGRLRGLDVAYSDVTDASIEVVARGCPGLTDLNVAQCVGVTDRSITALVESGVRLTCLGSEGCPGINYETLALLMRDCRRPAC